MNVLKKHLTNAKISFLWKKLTADSYTLLPVFILILELSKDFPS